MRIYRGYRQYEWKGLRAYKCLYCHHSFPGPTGLRRIMTHVQSAHRAQRNAHRATFDALSAVEFASVEAADLAATLGPKQAKRLTGQTPSSEGGYTVADVRAATKPDTPAHEEKD